MEQPTNPYSPPESSELAKTLLLAGETLAIKQRRLAIILFSFSVGMATIFTILDDTVVQSRVGPWPIILGSTVISLLSSFITKDRVFAPLCCFGSILICSMTVALTRSLEYAQLHLALPIACVFSAPSLIIAGWLSRK